MFTHGLHTRFIENQNAFLEEKNEVLQKKATG
jgi:hypothetical protein